MSARRLLCVYQHAPTPGAPGIYRHRQLLAELVRRGWAVDLVSTPLNYMTGVRPAAYARKPYRHEMIDGIDHHWVWALGGIHASKARRVGNYASFAAGAFLRAAALPRPDAILVSSPPLSVGAIGPALAARFRRPWILEVRDVWPESAASVGWLSEGSRLYRGAERLAHRLADGARTVVVPTPGLVPHVLRHGSHNVAVVTGGVVDSAPSAESRSRMRRSLELDDGTCLFLYLGAVGIANGLETLLDAIARLDESVDAQVIVVGDGSDRVRLAERVARDGLRRVRIVGAVAKDAVSPYLAAADVCLHVLLPDPVFASALPTKVLEYLGAHRPFVTTVPGLPERLALASGGGFAPTAERLAAELERWAALSQTERVAAGDRAFAFGEERYGLVAAASRLERVLVDGSHPRPHAETLPVRHRAHSL